jgi:multimeric flavodoxin WrbA
MEIIGLVGSPRKGGNTDILVDTVLSKAKDNGHTTSKVYIYDHDVGPCIDCRGCKKDENVCVVEDEMQDIYPRLDAADVIVFGTPVYWCGPSGPMKNLFDRLRPYFSNGRLKGKKAALVAPAKDGPAEGDLLVEMFRRSFDYLEVEFLGQALGTAYDKGDILNDSSAIDRARAIGSKL